LKRKITKPKILNLSIHQNYKNEMAYWVVCVTWHQIIQT